MNRPGDWNCRSCQHMNFQRRDSCQRCGDLRPGGDISYGARLGFTTGPDVRPGDWYCAIANCGAHNFASRSSCFKCGAFKEDFIIGAGAGAETEFPRSRGFGFGGAGAGGAARSGWKSGDWICNRFGCNEHNFASRTECFRCNAPKESASKASF
ncbi:transcription initiation factor TFIID subunit 15-like [Andrographis paniculata]|uniref:transcription initiation factor TFIID subunit 15-like n=1 Tax=Andrographis paniculata TaxID=175694 RepID=UPI0021E71D82|nr:transcription initiation factor TFIID subunit 15-like [Andrographis paniculata]